MANIELDGPNKKIKVDSGDLTLDVPGDIVLDADGGDLVFADGGTNLLKVTNSSSDVVLQPQVDAKDIKFNQYDGRTLLDINDGGFVAIANGATGPGQLRLYEDTDNGTNFTAFQVGTQSGDITYTLPTADGSNGQALTTNGSGTLSFASAGTTINTNADNRVITGSGTANTLNGEANLTFDGTALTANKVILTNSSGLTGGASSDGFITNADDTNTGIVFPDSDRIQFWTNDSEKMRIESTGSVEIKIDGSGFKNFVKFENLAGDTTYGVVGAEGANSAIIGSGDTALKVDAANDTFRPYTITGTGGRDNAIDLGSGSHRYQVVYAGTGAINTSDERLKNNIADTDLGLDFINKLKPKKYKLNDGKSDRIHYGLISQDVETVLGDISKATKDFAGFIKTDISKDNKDDLDKVTKLINDNVDPLTGEEYTSDKLKTLQDRKTEIENKNDDIYALRYEEFISPIIKAIQELSARVKTLEG